MRESNQVVWMPLRRRPLLGTLKRLFFGPVWRAGRCLVTKGVGGDVHYGRWAENAGTGGPRVIGPHLHELSALLGRKN
jgi:hypothetical protein